MKKTIIAVRGKKSTDSNNGQYLLNSVCDIPHLIEEGKDELPPRIVVQVKSQDYPVWMWNHP